MATVSVSLIDYFATSGTVAWLDDISLGSAFDDAGAEQTLNRVILNDNGVPLGEFRLIIVEANSRFTRAFEMAGRIILEASDGEMLEVMIADADMTEPYEWVPVNSDEVIAFAGHIRTLSNTNITLTLTDDIVDILYEVRVRAVATGFTAGEWSDIETVVLDETAISALERPTGLSLTEASGDITADWDDVADATGYVLEWREEGSGAAWQTANVSAPPHTFTP